jgi:hypothetical protein
LLLQRHGSQNVMSHICKLRKNRQSPKVRWTLVPGRIRVGSQCREKQYSTQTDKSYQDWNRKLDCRLECDTQKIKLMSRVKITWYKNVKWLDVSPGLKLSRKSGQKYE